MINIASMCGKLKQVSSEHQKTLKSATNVETVSNLMNQFVQSALKGDHKDAGFSNSAYGMSKLGMIAVGRVHAKQLAHRKVKENFDI